MSTQSETHTDDFDSARYEDIRQLQYRLAERRYARTLKAYGVSPVISMLDEPTTDEYGVLTIGHWGGYIVQIAPMIFNDRLVLTPQSCPALYDHGWCYDKGGAAYLAALVWNPETQGEPLGYKKRATPGLRKPGETARAADGQRISAETLVALLLAEIDR